MHTTLDTVLFGTGITVLTLFAFVAAVGASLVFTWITYSAIRWFPIYIMRTLKFSDQFSVKRFDGNVITYKNCLVLLNIASFSIVLVNGKSDTRNDEA